MTTKICNKLIDLEHEIAELNTQLSNEDSSAGIFKMQFNKQKLADNVTKAKALQTNVRNLIKRIEVELSVKQ